MWSQDKRLLCHAVSRISANPCSKILSCNTHLILLKYILVLVSFFFSLSFNFFFLVYLSYLRVTSDYPNL
jgi:hypothetical protein